MEWFIDSSGQTTRARSVETVDGYVSRGRAPPASVPQDHAMLQDFAVYLELRLKSQNLSMLRRIFADFLNEQENTLQPMMRQGCTIVTIFPVLRISAQRRQQAEFLLAKPKWPLDARGCVFLYLQYRTATRNMALLKHLFLQFVEHRETALLDFVQRGCQVISVIPFELPQLAPPVCQAPPPMQQVAEVQKVKKRGKGRTSSPRPVSQLEEVQKKKKRRTSRVVEVVEVGETTTANVGDSVQQQDAVAPDDTAAAEVEEVQAPQKKKKGRPRVSETRGSLVANAVEAALQQVAPALVRVSRVKTKQRKKKGKSRRASKTKDSTAAIADDSLQQQDVVAPMELEGTASSVQQEDVAGIEGSEGDTAPVEDSDAATTIDASDDFAASSDDITASPDDAAAAIDDEATAIDNPNDDAASVVGPGDDSALAQLEEPDIVTKRRRKRTSAASVTVTGGNEEADTDVASGSSSAAVSTPERDESKDTDAATNAEPVEASPVESLKSKRGRKRKVDSTTPSKEKSHKRGKPVMSDDMCRSQLELTRKMEPFEAQIPWEAVYSNLPAPFDETQHPELSKKFRKFWRYHSRAVWERDFWVPLSRKTSLPPFKKRNNRQLTAKKAFESIIISVYKELGAKFFVMLDSLKPRHPGWWYRGPVVALFALQQIKDENAVWDYVTNEALQRFPDCKLALPLRAPNSAAVSKCHQRDSDSMWMANHQLASEIQLAIAAVKASQQTCRPKANRTMSRR